MYGDFGAKQDFSLKMIKNVLVLQYCVEDLNRPTARHSKIAYHTTIPYRARNSNYVLFYVIHVRNGSPHPAEAYGGPMGPAEGSSFLTNPIDGDSACAAAAVKAPASQVRPDTRPLIVGEVIRGRDGHFGACIRGRYTSDVQGVLAKTKISSRENGIKIICDARYAAEGIEGALYRLRKADTALLGEKTPADMQRARRQGICRRV